MGSISPRVLVYLACFVLGTLASLAKQVAFPAKFSPDFTRRDRVVQLVAAAFVSGFTALSQAFWLVRVPTMGPEGASSLAIACGLGWTEILAMVRSLIIRSMSDGTPRGPGV